MFEEAEVCFVFTLNAEEQVALPHVPSSIATTWSGIRESNSSSLLGRQEHYHYANPAYVSSIALLRFVVKPLQVIQVFPLVHSVFW